MKAITKISREELEVVSISWPRAAGVGAQSDLATTITVVSELLLFTVCEREAEIVERTVDDFTMLDSSFDSRAIVLMWRPLYEANIWEALHEREPIAREKLAQLLTEARKL